MKVFFIWLVKLWGLDRILIDAWVGLQKMEYGGQIQCCGTLEYFFLYKILYGREHDKGFVGWALDDQKISNVS